MPFHCARPAMRNSIGWASLPSGPHSVSIRSTYHCAYGRYRPTLRPGSASSFERDNTSIWRRHLAEKRTISAAIARLLSASLSIALPRNRTGPCGTAVRVTIRQRSIYLQRKDEDNGPVVNLESPSSSLYRWNEASH